MAGLAAYFGTKAGTVTAIAGGLAPRGDEVADWHDPTAPLALAVRAGIPRVHRGPYGAAVVVDGVAEPSTLLTRYADGGAAAVLGARGAPVAEPYAAVLADPERGVLVLCRNGDGPSLYYARHGADVLVGSEPAALLDGGLPAEPDPATVRAFLDHGRCDGESRTFYAGVRRVLPGQVLEVSAEGVRLVPSVRGEHVDPPPSTAVVLQRASQTGRVGVRLGDTVAGAALLGVALVSHGVDDTDAPGPLPVYTATALDTDDHPYLTPVVDALRPDSVRAEPVPVTAADVDEMLAGLGEPVPDPDALYSWCAARKAAGEVDALLDPAGAGALLAGRPVPGHLSRVADRIATRFGVALRMPYRQVAGSGGALRCELAALCRRGLPPEAATRADRRVAVDDTVGLLRALRAELYATFLSSAFGTRPWHDARAVVEGFGDLLAGRRTDADRFWRAYLVERWLRRLATRDTADRALEPNPGRDLTTTVDGARWLRFPVRTRTLRAGDPFAATLAWYVGELVTSACGEDRFRRRFRRSWYLVVAAKPLAVAQGRVRPLWDVRPSWWARRVSTFVRDRSWQSLGNPWTMQLAIEEVGLRRVLLAAAAGAGGRLVRRRGVFDRVAGEPVRQVTGPVELSVYPANVAVAAAPRDPQRALDDLVAAVRTGLRDEVAGGLAGGAVVATDRAGGGCRVVAVTGDRPASFYAAACADDPLGRLAGTPAAVVALAPPSTSPKARHAPRRPARR
ncbi:MAG TPA: hypothetical protein VGN37_01250 [Actinocatenispora sp.]